MPKAAQTATASGSADPPLFSKDALIDIVRFILRIWSATNIGIGRKSYPDISSSAS